MLKWTASGQKLVQTPNAGMASRAATRTPSQISEQQRKRRRATIANKENIPYTSTPMVQRMRNSPLVLGPLKDILNVTAEATPPPSPDSTLLATSRRHSTLGVSQLKYAATLPRYEEEYSPSTLPLPLPSGQQLALRGLLPDPFLANRRYLSGATVAVKAIQEQSRPHELRGALQKRKLDAEFLAIAQECAKECETAKVQANVSTSNKMGDKTLDNLIDAILDSACKDEKKKKSRKSFNLRRRTLLKNQPEPVAEVLLSPSYAAGDDPASDLSFRQFVALKSPPKTQPVTPKPLTPSTGCLLSHSLLCQMPTPSAGKNDSTVTFRLETPIRNPAQKRRRPSHLPDSDAHSAAERRRKKFKVDTRKYFEIGLALPSIYV